MNWPNRKKNIIAASIVGLLILCLSACDKDPDKKMEQLTIEEFETQKDSLGNSLSGNSTFKQLTSTSNSVLLTGMDRFRLVPIYKISPKKDRNINYDEGTSFYQDYSDESGETHEEEEDDFKYFMPGMDIITGYNLINLGHYDLESGKLSYFFEKPVLVKTLYFPGVKPDSLKNMPISRNYFMVSVYDEDTNNDSLINKKDLRKFYHFDDANSKKTPLIPPRYSAVRSTYDYKNDIMYIYTRYDSNKNGTPEKSEPMHIFWIALNQPAVARKIM